MTRWRCRQARTEEADAIEALQVRCVWELGRGFYTEHEIESYIFEIGTLDMALIDDGTYFVAVDHGVIVGCGGWSVRTPHYEQASPAAVDAIPRIRGFFVDPDRARQGIGRAIMAHIECAILSAGHRSVALTAMLSGVPFYRSLAYTKTGNTAVELASGIALPAIDMIKTFDPVRKVA